MRYMLQVGRLAIINLLFLGGIAFAQTRTAIVIGNSDYQSVAKLKTPETDAAIVAETLRAAGYAVTELHNVRQGDIGQSLRDFLDAVEAGGSDGAAIVYYSGYAAQSGGENYLVPVDATIKTDADVGTEAFRLNDLLDELAKAPLAARVVILDASRDHRFGLGTDKPVAKGLAMGSRVTGTLLAFAATPDAVSIDGSGTYSLYSGSLVTQMRQPGQSLEQIFKSTRQQVNQLTKGAQTPWMVSDLGVEVRLFNPAEAQPAPESPAPAPLPATPEATAPAPATAPVSRPVAAREDRVVSRSLLQSLSPDEAYAAVVEADTLEAYQWFVELYPDYRLTPRIWDIISTRRETVLWQRTLAQNTARAYWNYLKRYPDGPHASEAREYLASLSAPTAPPVNYVPTPEPLPPDYSDEAVGVAEVVPEGVTAPVDVFEALVPVFVPVIAQTFVDPIPVDVFPDPIPVVVGDPASVFIDRSVNIDNSVNINNTTINKTTNITNIKTINNTNVVNNKTINNLTTNKTGFVKGTPNKVPTKGPTATAAGVDKTKKTGLSLPPGKTPANKGVPGKTPVNKGVPGKETTTKPAPVGPNKAQLPKPGVTLPAKTNKAPTATPAGPKPATSTPLKPVPTHPGLPPVPGTTVKTPSVGTHPGLPSTLTKPTPGPVVKTPAVKTPVNPTPKSTLKPAPSLNTTTPVTKPKTTGPKPTLTKPAVKTPVAPKPTVKTQVAPKPTVRTPVAPKPTVRTPVAPKPTVRTPVAPKPTLTKPAVQKPVIRKPVAPPKPVVQKPLPHPTTVAPPRPPRVTAPPRPPRVTAPPRPPRVTAPPRPVAPKPVPKTPNCRIVNGKKICT